MGLTFAMATIGTTLVNHASATEQVADSRPNATSNPRISLPVDPLCQPLTSTSPPARVTGIEPAFSALEADQSVAPTTDSARGESAGRGPRGSIVSVAM